MASNIEDSYDHLEEGVAYVETNVPGIGFDEASFNSQLCVKCDCEGKNCFEDSCACVKYSGLNYNEGMLVKNKLISNSHVIECNGLCNCNMQCSNRLVQLGPRTGLVIFKDPRKGFGVKTNQIIKSGSFICEYTGELISKSEAKLRSKNDNANYIFVLREHCGGTVIETIVDATKIGNIGRYINHSCDPNSIVIPVRNDSPVPKLAIFSIVDIQNGEEITYSYSGNDSCETFGKTLCFCGTEKCKKYLPYNKELLD